MMKSFLHMLVKDPLRKFLALVFTLVLYWALNESKQREITLDRIPVQIVCDDGFVLSEYGIVPSVRLRVRGSDSIIKKLRAEDISGSVRITAETKGMRSGNAVIPLNAKDFSVPRGVEVMRVEEPREIRVEVQRKITRSLPVRVETSGRIPAGWKNDEISTVPDRVDVTGPENFVKTLKDVVTETLNIDGETMTFSKNGLLLKKHLGRGLSYSVDSADVVVKISRIPDYSKTLKDIPVRCLMPPGKVLNAVPDKMSVDVTLSGQPGYVDRINRSDVMVFADLSEPHFARQGDYAVHLNAVLNNADGKSRVVSVEPQEIRVRMMPAEKREK
jgi:YbbR domain-containing protein